MLEAFTTMHSSEGNKDAFGSSWHFSSANIHTFYAPPLHPLPSMAEGKHCLCGSVRSLFLIICPFPCFSHNCSHIFHPFLFIFFLLLYYSPANLLISDFLHGTNLIFHFSIAEILLLLLWFNFIVVQYPLPMT